MPSLREKRWLSALLCASLAACSTWGVPRDAPASLPHDRRHSVARVQLQNGTTVEVYRLAVRQDTVFGDVWHGAFEPVRIPVSDIKSVRVLEIQRTRTTLVILAVPLVALVAFLALLQNGYSGGT